MARPIIKIIVKLTALKQNQGQLSGNNINKQAKKNRVLFSFYCVFGLFQSVGNPRVKALSLKVT